MRLFGGMITVLLLLGWVCTPCAADLSEVKVYLGERLLKEDKLLEAKSAFRSAIEINFENGRAWKGYERTVIELYKLKLADQEMVLEPRFDITYDDVKIHPLGRFGKKAVTIRGRVKNMADIAFENVEVEITFVDEAGETVKVFSDFLKDIGPKETKPFGFTVITDKFKDYRVEVHKR